MTDIGKARTVDDALAYCKDVISSYSRDLKIGQKEEVASRLLSFSFGNHFADWRQEYPVVNEIQALASDLEWSNSSDLDEDWQKLKSYILQLEYEIKIQSSDLYCRVVDTKSAPRALIVEFLHFAVNERHDFPSDLLLTRSEGSQFRNPGTLDEFIVGLIFHALIMQDIVDEDAELQDLCNIAQELTDQTDDASLWAEFIEKVNNLNDSESS